MLMSARDNKNNLAVRMPGVAEAPDMVRFYIMILFPPPKKLACYINVRLEVLLES